ncbi:hypothetical protein [Thalassolituus marinus]|jgi:hypothetical protein|uniref:Uncharacterized protein n=1 Tax=Thalassolituus marinus TaxID=671053 RepID=A0ABS7ZUP5_9GAMM|nr:hypothetical protein [Thalassolituus marinus]MCA6065488.1 hypothetical protein [Thalassolituus marinus]
MNRFPLIERIRRFYRLPDNYPELNWTRTRLYRRRLEQVKSGWIITGLVMLASDSIAVVFVLGAFAGFLSLAFLEPDSQA